MYLGGGKAHKSINKAVDRALAAGDATIETGFHD